MTTLVVGGAGYIGSHVTVALHEVGFDPVILDDFSQSSPQAVDAIRKLTSVSLPVEECDATDLSDIERVFTTHDVGSVIHLAAFKSAPESLVEPLKYYRNNLNSVIAVAEASVDRQVQRFVFSSSAAVYGAATDMPVSEDSPTIPINPYGQTKLMSEQILADVAAISELTVTSLRYFNPVGAHPSGVIGEDPTGAPGNLVPRVMQTAAGSKETVKIFGTDYPTKDGTAVRDYIHVVDLAEGHVAALVAPPTSNGHSSSSQHASTHHNIYNLGTGVGSSVLEVIHAAVHATGQHIDYETVGRRPGDTAQIWANSQKARQELNWVAKRGLPEMLRDHWNWCVNNPQGY